MTVCTCLRRASQTSAGSNTKRYKASNKERYKAQLIISSPGQPAFVIISVSFLLICITSTPTGHDRDCRIRSDAKNLEAGIGTSCGNSSGYLSEQRKVE